ncbi:MAG: hypothetical protein RIF41_31540, partial [Polyangiaceae bacterium]
GGTGGGGGLVITMGDFENIQPVFDTPDDEDDPTFTADGLELYFNAGQNAGIDIFRSTRGTRAESWGAPSPVTTLSTSAVETNPALSPDGLTIYFARQVGTMDIFVAKRANRSDMWPTPVPVDELNSMAADYPRSVSSDGTLLAMHSTRDGGLKVFFAERDTSSDPWDEPYIPDFINQTVTTADPWISPDALHVYWRQAGTIHHASRPDRQASFVTIGTLDELDQDLDQEDPWLNPEQSYIMFVKGPQQNRDIFEAFRTVDRP